MHKFTQYEDLECIQIQKYKQVLRSGLKPRLKKISVLLPSLTQDSSSTDMPENLNCLSSDKNPPVEQKSFDKRAFRLTPHQYIRSTSAPRENSPPSKKAKVLNPVAVSLSRKHGISKILALAFRNR